MLMRLFFCCIFLFKKATFFLIEVARTYGTIVKEVTRAKNRIRRKFDFHNIDTGITAKTWNAGYYKYARQWRISPPSP